MDASFDFHGSVAFHTPIVISHQQNDQLRDMAQTGSVILIRIGEWQVCNVIQNKSERKTEYEHRTVLVLTFQGQVKSQLNAVKERKRNIELRHTIHFELVLELSILLCVRNLHG